MTNYTINSPFVQELRFCAYLRDSGGRDQELSIEQQRVKIVEFCQDKGFVITRIFQDAAQPGSSVINRIEFLNMIKYLESGTKEMGVIVWSYSRLSRAYDDFMFYVTSLRRLGKQVISITDAIPDTLDGRLLESVTAWKNARFREDMSRDIRRGLHYIVELHHAYPAPSPPTGYKAEAFSIPSKRGGSRILHRLVVDDATAPLMRQAFQMRAVGYSIQAIIDALPGLQMTTQAFGKLLYSSIYIGRFEYGGAVIDNFCEPLVDIPTWEAAQRVNEKHRSHYYQYHPRSMGSRYLLSGLVFCTACGQRMKCHAIHKRQYNKTYSYYLCLTRGCPTGYIPKHKLEQAVLAALAEVVSRPGVLADVYAEVQRQAADDNQDYDNQHSLLLQNQSQVRAKITRIVSAIADTGHSSAMLRELADLEAQAADLERQLSQPPPTSDIPPRDWVISQIGIALTDAATPEEQRQMILNFVTRVDVAKTPDGIAGSVMLWLGVVMPLDS